MQQEDYRRNANNIGQEKEQRAHQSKEGCVANRLTSTDDTARGVRRFGDSRSDAGNGMKQTGGFDIGGGA